MHTEDAALERHWKLSEIAERWNLSVEMCRLIFKDEPGVVRIRWGVRKARTTYVVPESVLRRVHVRLITSR